MSSLCLCVLWMSKAHCVLNRTCHNHVGNQSLAAPKIILYFATETESTAGAGKSVTEGCGEGILKEQTLGV